MTDYLSKADLYRAACAPRDLPDNFADSMRWYLIQDADLIVTRDGGVRDDYKSVALRCAVRLAEEWRGLAEASRELGHESEDDGDPKMAWYHMGENHQAKYCANTLLRHLAQELYRDQVPEEERVL